MRYILSFIKIQSHNVYSLPLVKYKVGLRPVSMRNVFTKYIEGKNVRHYGLMDTFSEKFSVIYKGGKKIKGHYCIITIRKNIYLKFIHCRLFDS